MLRIVPVHHSSSRPAVLLPLPVNPTSPQLHPPLSPVIPYLAAGVSFLLLGWDRCQSHPFDPSDPGVRLSGGSIFSPCWGSLLRRCLAALPRSGVQVLLAQAVVAAGGVKDVGLELGACGLLNGGRHAGTLATITACGVISGVTFYLIVSLSLSLFMMLFMLITLPGKRSNPVSHATLKHAVKHIVFKGCRSMLQTELTHSEAKQNTSSLLSNSLFYPLT